MKIENSKSSVFSSTTVYYQQTSPMFSAMNTFLLVCSSVLLTQFYVQAADKDSTEVNWASNGGPDSKYNCEVGYCDSKYDDELLPDEEVSSLAGQTRLIVCDGSKHGENVCKYLAKPYNAISAKCTCPNNYGNFSKVGVCQLEFADQESWGLCNWPGAWPENRLTLCFEGGEATDPWTVTPYENQTASPSES